MDKKYRWTNKKRDADGDYLILVKEEFSGTIITTFDNMAEPDPLTETEVRQWGYNPDMYEREEVN